jgi:hypothetical protein
MSLLPPGNSQRRDCSPKPHPSCVQTCTLLAVSSEQQVYLRLKSQLISKIVSVQLLLAKETGMG